MMHPGEEEELANRGWSKIQPSPLFGGEVFLTRVFPGWIKSPEKFKGGSSVMKSVVPGERKRRHAGMHGLRWDHGLYASFAQEETEKESQPRGQE